MDGNESLNMTAGSMHAMRVFVRKADRKMGIYALKALSSWRRARMSSLPNPILSLGISRGPSDGRPFTAPGVAGVGPGPAAEIDGNELPVLLFMRTLMLGTVVPLVSERGLDGGFGGGMLKPEPGGGGGAWLTTRGLPTAGMGTPLT